MRPWIYRIRAGLAADVRREATHLEGEEELGPGQAELLLEEPVDVTEGQPGVSILQHPGVASQSKRRRWWGQA